MDDHKLTRRTLLERLPVAGMAVVVLAACGENNKPKVVACADPNSLTMAENSLRQSGHYVEVSADAAKSCSVCNFFSSDEGAACGKCQIFQGPVNPRGHCDSWAQKQA